MASADVSGVDFSECAQAASTDFLSWGNSIAHAVAASHCTTTTLKCLSSALPIPAACVITVQDDTSAPTSPTGVVEDYVFPAAQPSIHFQSSCTLIPLATTAGRSTCIINFTNPSGVLTSNAAY
ncbi:MAG: hypothetical protein ACLP50_02950, partial [Solirubrobacteraceae bacterium]